jgi:hypothetical protein
LPFGTLDKGGVFLQKSGKLGGLADNLECFSHSLDHIILADGGSRACLLIKARVALDIELAEGL